MDTYTTQQCAQYYDEVLTFSDSTYEENLTQLGYICLLYTSPSPRDGLLSRMPSSA